MEKWISKWLQCILRDKDFNEKGVQSPLSYSCLRRRFNLLAFNNPSGTSPFLYICFVVFSVWQCVVYDSNFDLHI